MIGQPFLDLPSFVMSSESERISVIFVVAHGEVGALVDQEFHHRDMTCPCGIDQTGASFIGPSIDISALVEQETCGLHAAIPTCAEERLVDDLAWIIRLR